MVHVSLFTPKLTAWKMEKLVFIVKILLVSYSIIDLVDGNDYVELLQKELMNGNCMKPPNNLYTGLL